MAFTAEAVRDELTAKVSELVRASPGDSVKERLSLTARYLHLPYSRIQDFWHREVRRIEAHEADQIRAYYKAAQELIEARKAYDEHRRSFLSNHPSLARLAPRALEDTVLSNEAAVVAASELARKRR